MEENNIQPTEEVTPQKGQQQEQPTIDFGQITGGAYQSWDEAQGEIERLRAERQQFEERLQQPEEVFANDISKKVNEMFKNGATQNEVNNFFRLNSLDLKSLKPQELIKESLKLEYPYLNELEIQAEFEDRYGYDPDDEDAQKRVERKMKMDAASAEKALSEMIVKASEPEAVRSNRQAEQQRQQLRTAWEQQLGAIKDLKFPVSHKAGDFEYSYELPVELSEEVRKSLLENLVQAGSNPTPQEIEQAKNAAVMMSFIRNPEKAIKAIVGDAISKAMEYRARKSENNESVTRPEPGEARVQSDMAEARKKILARNRF